MSRDKVRAWKDEHRTYSRFIFTFYPYNNASGYEMQDLGAGNYTDPLVPTSSEPGNPLWWALMDLDEAS